MISKPQNTNNPQPLGSTAGGTSLQQRLFGVKSFFFVAALAFALNATAAPVGNSFTYSGRLSPRNGGAPVNGSFEFLLTLFASPNDGAALQTIEKKSVPVVDGFFKTEADFGETAFSSGEERWMQVGIRAAGSNAPFEVFQQRQRISAVPHAIAAAKATLAQTASTASSAATADRALTAATADHATAATTADRATTATNADRAATAATADRAATAATADRATIASEADHAEIADQATTSLNADRATTAASADRATTAASADRAGSLLLDGGDIRVAGAGVATDTPVFIHKVNKGNKRNHVTTIDNPHCNGNPNAILLLTHNWSADTAIDQYETHAVGVFYSGSRWSIFREDMSEIPDGRAFNVLVVKP